MKACQPLIAVLISALLCLVIAPASASAQSRAELADQLEALEKQVRALQRRVFPNRSEMFDEDPGAQPPGGRPPATGVDDRALLADLSVRMSEIESQIRTLTGRVEEIGFQHRRFVEQFDRYKADVEFRLTQLERGDASVPGTATPLPGQAGPESRPEGAPSGLIPTPTPEDAEALLERNGRPAQTNGPESQPAETRSTPLPEGNPQEQYDYALSQLRRGQFDRAEAAFMSFLERHPDLELAGNAQYWLGESYYVRRDYPRAAQAFLQGYQDYGDGPKGADSLLKLGMTLAALEQPTEACAAFDELEARYPEADDRLFRLMAAERARLDCGG